MDLEVNVYWLVFKMISEKARFREGEGFFTCSSLESMRNMSVAYMSSTSNSQEVDTFQKKQSVTEVPCGFGLVLPHCNLGTKVDVSITVI